MPSPSLSHVHRLDAFAGLLLVCVILKPAPGFVVGPSRLPAIPEGKHVGRYHDEPPTSTDVFSERAPGSTRGSFAIHGALTAGLCGIAVAAVCRKFGSSPTCKPKLHSHCSAMRAFESELGVQAPVGFWDPLGFARDGDEMKFKRRRASEVKHGRVCMYACLGYMVPEYFRMPGFLSPSTDLKFSQIPNGLGAMSKIPELGGVQIILFCGFLEYGLCMQTPDRAPGDFEQCGFLGITYDKGVDDPDAKKRSLNAELANGRLAMFAILGLIGQNWIFGTTGPEMWLPAFEDELGVQAPVGYWDPLGLARDGDADAFYRRRCTEVKHGRVSMIATIGYFVPEYFKFDGYLAPAFKLQFKDIPSGLAAITRVPHQGWEQVLFFCAFCEIFATKQFPTDPPGKLSGHSVGYGPTYYGRLGIYKGDGIADPATKKRALNAELANGRLAMFSIMGMLVQNGVMGSTGPEMWLPIGALKKQSVEKNS